MANKHSFETLEFPKVIEFIVGNCMTPYGRKYVSNIAPMDDTEAIRQSLAEISEMSDIVKFAVAFPLYRIEDDCRELLDHSTVEGGILEPLEMLQVLTLVVDSIRLNAYDKEEREKYPIIDEFLDRIRAFPELRTEIERAIDRDGSIKDNASSKLRKIRIELADTRRKIINKLEGLLSQSSKKTGWQDDVVTQRNQRYVIPIPANRYESNAGILHDRSQSGATFYVEPQATVELNNRIGLLMQDEFIEIDRILRAITAEIATRSEALRENIRVIGQLDRIHASALFSVKVDGHAPQIIDESVIDLVDARHPLLVMQLGDAKKVVPTDISLGEDRQVVLVTGPNTGGKTITLKTVGLSVLMARAGLHISADSKSRVGFFRDVYADIGDEQSIELSLSTFSSHVRNIIHSLHNASPRTLLLFDEIGAGTDPKEGSALAESILLHGIKMGALMIATTHYSQLKTLAMEHPEIENASLDFNHETLAPTFRLQLGLPGSSYAVEIASRLGMPQSICENASRLLGDSEKSLTELIATLQGDLNQIREDRKELSKRLAKAKAQEQFYRMEMEQLTSDTEGRRKQALGDTEQFLRDTRQEIEKLVADLRESNASGESVKKFHSNLKKREKQLANYKQSDKKPDNVDHSEFSPGDQVTVISLDKTGELDKLIGTGRARVKIGNITITVELRNLRKVTDQPTAKPESKPVSSYSGDGDAVNPEIHLRGMTVDEAIVSLEHYLDSAIMCGLTQVYIVHGKGTGALRQALSSYLKKHRDVDSLRLGDWNEGGSGVTIVKLRK